VPFVPFVPVVSFVFWCPAHGAGGHVAGHALQ
jgi:hypothetical protein